MGYLAVPLVKAVSSPYWCFNPIRTIMLFEILRLHNQNDYENEQRKTAKVPNPQITCGQHRNVRCSKGTHPIPTTHFKKRYLRTGIGFPKIQPTKAHRGGANKKAQL